MRLGSVLFMMNKQAMTLWLTLALRLSGKENLCCAQTMNEQKGNQP
jgi:hypothetical protein